MIFWAAYPAVATRFLPSQCFGKRAQTGRSIRAADFVKHECVLVKFFKICFLSLSLVKY